MIHKAVLTWQRRCLDFPLPNRFLGIAAASADSDASISMAAQCALRWVARKNRIDKLRSAPYPDLLVVSYEFFRTNTLYTLADVKRVSLDNRKDHL
jgi:hypothetical protein